MGCNCKNKISNLDKISDEPIVDGELNLFEKIIQFILQMLFGILVGVIIIIIMFPFLLYLTYCIMFKKEPTFNIINLKKRFDKNGEHKELQDKN